MVGAGGVAGGGSNPLVLFSYDRGVVERLVWRVAPILATHALVQAFGQRLGEPVGQRLDHDRVVIVLGGLELGDLLVESDARSHSEQAHPVTASGVLRCDEIGEGEVRAAVGFHHLLSYGMNGGDGGGGQTVGIRFPGSVPEQDILGAIRVGGEESDHRSRLEPTLLDDPPEHGARVAEHVSRALADGSVLEDLRVVAGELPGLEERRPVDSRRKIAEREL